MEYNEPLARSMLVSGLTALLAVALGILGISLLLAFSDLPPLQSWAQPSILAYVIGALAVVAAVAVVIPSMRFWGGLLAALVILDQVVFHAVNGNGALALLALAFLVPAVFVTWWRRPTIARPDASLTQGSAAL